MKKITIIFFFSFLLMNENCFSQNNTFVREYSGTGLGSSWLDITYTGYVLAGASNSTVNITKTDWSGNIVWSRSYGPFGGSQPLGDIKRLPGGKYVFTAGSSTIGNFFLIEIDSIGNVLFSKKFMSQTNNGPLTGSVEEMSNRNLIVSTVVWNQNNGMNYCIITRCDSLGNILWSRSLTSYMSMLLPEPDLVKEGANHDLILVKSNIVTGDPPRLLVARLNASASVVKWANSYGGLDCRNPARDGVLIKGNDIIISNSVDSNLNMTFKPQLIQIDSSGNIVQYKKYSGSYDFWNSIYPTSDNGYICSGYSRRFYGNPLGVLVKVDSVFNIQWAKRQGVSGPNHYGCFNNIAKQTPDLSFISSGTNRLFKTDIFGTSGCMDSTISYTSYNSSWGPVPDQLGFDTLSITSTSVTIITTNNASLSVNTICFTGINDQESNNEIEIYPNPSSDKINIKFEFYPNEKPIAVLYNIFGQQVLYQQISSAQSEINIHQLASGIYFLQLKVGEKVFSKKIVKE